MANGDISCRKVYWLNLKIENGDLTSEEEEMPLTRQKAEIEKNDNADQVKSDENTMCRLRESFEKWLFAMLSANIARRPLSYLIVLSLERMIRDQIRQLRDENQRLKDADFKLFNLRRC